MLFISYAREDRRAAAKLVSELEAEGLRYVIDPDLAQGDPFWREAVARQFPRCRLMVCLASARADCSPWVEQEQRAFHGPKVRIALDRTAVRSDNSRDAQPHAVEPRNALQAIRAALALRPGRSRRSRRAAARLPQAEQRSRQIEHQHRRLDAFLRCRRRGPAILDVAGASARIGTHAMEIRLRALEPASGGERTFIGVTPVTNSQYRAFVDGAGYPEPPTWRRAAFRDDNAPVTGVTWFEACAFAAWAGGSLPSEAEWMEAARGGDAGRRFATATGMIDDAAAHYGQPFARRAPAAATAHAPNPEGYYGLCGNCWDWCASARGPHRAIRGGGWMDAASFCTIDSAYRNAPIDRDCCVGFRIKVTLAS